MMGAHPIYMNHPSSNRGSNPVPLIAFFALIIVAFAVFISAAFLTSQRSETPTPPPATVNTSSLRSDAAFMSGFIVLFGLGGVVVSVLFWGLRGALYGRRQRALQANSASDGLVGYSYTTVDAEAQRYAQAYATVQASQHSYAAYAKRASRRGRGV